MQDSKQTSSSPPSGNIDVLSAELQAVEQRRHLINKALNVSASLASRDAIWRVQLERARQDLKWGSQRDHTPEKWLAILVEEVGEVANAILEHKPLAAEVRDEITQVAAVAVCWLEAIARSEADDGN